MHSPKPPLYRKVNTTAHRAPHRPAGTFGERRRVVPDATRQPMHGRDRQGRDYTPLFRFLLSKVGERWDEVHSEAVRRLDRSEPIFWLVALREDQREDYVRVGESSYCSGLFVDDDGILRIVDASVGPDTLVPSCKCCTHTFNGQPFSRPFTAWRGSVEP